MKILLTLTLVLTATFAVAQTRGINYKAKLADNAGNVLANQSTTVKFSIYEGNMGINLVFQETHTTTTDANGIAIANIGEGTIITGDFTTIDWGTDTHFLKTEVDTGSGFVEIGNTEFKTVPYALHAKTVEDPGVTSSFAEATANLISANNTVADFVVGSPNTEDQNNINFDARMFWDDSKAAFRAGAVDGTQWNDVNRGLYSFAAGRNNTANGVASAAFGENNTAGGSGILIGGKNNSANASAAYSLVGGFNNTTTAAQSFVVGVGNIAATNYQAVVGKYNNSVAGNLFTVGNGVDSNNRGNALEVNEDGTVKAPTMTNAKISDDNHLITKGYFDSNTGDGLKRVTENGNTGWRLSDAFNDFSDIGFEAVDLSLDNGSSDNDGGATGAWSFAANFNTKASGDYSAAFGKGTKASNEASIAVGKYNVGNSDTLFEVGYGSSDGNRKTAFEVQDDGDVVVETLGGTGNANVIVDANGKLIREATTLQTSYYTISPLDFRPRSEGVDFFRDLHILYSKDNAATPFYVPLHLPHGAIIKSITFSYIDTYAPDNLEFVLLKNATVLLSTESTTNLFSAELNNLSVSIDNQYNTYTIRVKPKNDPWSSHTTSANLKMRKVYIEYQY